LDDVGTDRIAAFEQGLYTFMDSVYPNVGKTIAETGNLDETTEAALNQGIQEYKAEFCKVL
jgi:F-type H+-transporting ATPase subunit alpha